MSSEKENTVGENFVNQTRRVRENHHPTESYETKRMLSRIIAKQTQDFLDRGGKIIKVDHRHNKNEGSINAMAWEYSKTTSIIMGADNKK